MAPRDIRTFCRVSDGADALLRTAITRLALSARAYHRILKIARTIADLEGAADLQPKHVSEAIQYRSLDRRGLGEYCRFLRRLWCRRVAPRPFFNWPARGGGTPSSGGPRAPARGGSVSCGARGGGV